MSENCSLGKKNSENVRRDAGKNLAKRKNPSEAETKYVVSPAAERRLTSELLADEHLKRDWSSDDEWQIELPKYGDVS